MTDRLTAPQMIDDLVAANRILAQHGVLDGFGHVSLRLDDDPARFLMSRSLAPELVTAADILTYDLEGNSLDAAGRSLYRERFIHSAIYKARPDVQSIVHNHSPSIIPFGVSSLPLRPVYHMASFIGEGVPLLAPARRMVPLVLHDTKRWEDGVVRLHYRKVHPAK